MFRVRITCFDPRPHRRDAILGGETLHDSLQDLLERMGTVRFIGQCIDFDETVEALCADGLWRSVYLTLAFDIAMWTRLAETSPSLDHFAKDWALRLCDYAAEEEIEIHEATLRASA